MKKFTWFAFLGFALCMLLVTFGCQSGKSMPESTSTGMMVPDGSTGDPPLIPHDVEESDGGSSCIECHETGEMGAPVYPEWHATLTDCRQCHVVADEMVEEFKPKY